MNISVWFSANFQGPTVTNQFFEWFYNGLGSLGGWFLFFLLALVAVIWLLYDASRRHLSASGWRLAVVLTACLMIPAIIWRFSSNEVRISLVDLTEAIWYLGLLGGILPAVLLIGYLVTFQGMVGCIKGHPAYEVVLGECPVCLSERPRPVIISPAPVGPSPVRPPVTPAPSAPVKPAKPKVAAWLTSAEGRTYQLCQGETTIGRHSENDIQIDSDQTVGRFHAKIVEQNGHFKLCDLASKAGTRLNSHLLKQPALLESDDEICLGDQTVLRFKQ